MITGHEFTPHLWWRLFGPLKFSALLTDPAEFLSRPIRRHLQSPVRRPVPESVVAPLPKEGRETGMVGAMAKVECDLTETDLLLDLEDFFSKGLSDGEIAQRLAQKVRPRSRTHGPGCPNCVTFTGRRVRQAGQTIGVVPAVDLNRSANTSLSNTAAVFQGNSVVLCQNVYLSPPESERVAPARNAGSTGSGVRTRSTSTA